MNRTEDNKKLLETLGNALPDERTTITDISAYQAAVLADISRSLAMIADAVAPNVKHEEGNSNDNDSKWQI